MKRFEIMGGAALSKNLGPSMPKKSKSRRQHERFSALSN